MRENSASLQIEDILGPQLLDAISAAADQINNLYLSNPELMASMAKIRNAYVSFYSDSFKEMTSFLQSEVFTQMQVLCQELTNIVKPINYLVLPQLQKITDLTQIGDTLTSNQERAFSIMETDQFEQDFNLICQDYDEAIVNGHTTSTPYQQENRDSKPYEDRIREMVRTETKRDIADYYEVNQFSADRQQKDKNQGVGKEKVHSKVPMVLCFLLGNFIPNVLTYVDSPTLQRFFNQLLQILGIK